MRKPGHSRKKWTVASYDKKLAMRLAEECGIDELVTLILTARGYTDPFELEEFIAGDTPLSDPRTLPDMDRAVSRIEKALADFEKIAIYGDYDADGVTATAILYSYLSGRGANVMFYIPQRTGEGYGMNTASVDKLKEEGVSLIITVDNGISAVEEIAYAADLGIDVVVTDHHLPPAELPRAAAIVNPHLPHSGCPFPDLCGAVVAFKLVCALEDCECEELLPEYGDLCAIATATDIMPLRGENRIIVRQGLRHIRSAPRPGIAALLEEAGMAGGRLSASTLGFVIGPRLNAAGRMGRSDRAVRLLLETDPDETTRIAKELCEENAKRQQAELDLYNQALEDIYARGLQYDKIIVTAGEDWHSGVAGIVASRLTEQFGRPAFVLCISGDSASGSGRSIKGFDLHDALEAVSHLLTAYGGHELAGGLSLPADRIDELRRALREYAEPLEMPWPALRLDCKVNPKFISLDTVYALSPLEPYGSGNPAPLFGLYGMRVEAVSPISGGKHVRLTASRDGSTVQVLCFGYQAEEFPYLPGDLVDLAVTLDSSEYRGEISVTVQLRDIRLSGRDEDEILRSLRQYEALRRGALPAAGRAALLPGREEIAAVYRFLRDRNRPVIHYEEAAYRLNLAPARLRVILDILAERDLIRLEELAPGHARVMLCAVSGKVDINASPIFRKLEA